MVHECKKSKKYHPIAAIKLPQVPGAGLNKPTPNHVANIWEGFLKFGKGILTKMVPPFKGLKRIIQNF